MVDHACHPGNTFTLPDNMRYHLMLQRFCHKTAGIMSGNNAHAFGLPSDDERALLMDVLEHELDVLEGEISVHLSSRSNSFP